MAAALLILWSGMLSVLDSFLDNHYEMVPLVIGLALLLINHGRSQPIRYLYLLLLLLLLRVYLIGDERYLFTEITLYDYILIIIGFAAAYRLPQAFWKLLLPLFAIFLPAAALLSQQLRASPPPMDPFSAGELSVNQTALLLGASLTLSLCFFWNAATVGRPRGLRVLLTSFWLSFSLLSLVLVLSTKSRSGLGIPILSVAIILTVAYRHRLREALQAAGRGLHKRLNRLGLQTSHGQAYLALKLGGVGLLSAALAAIAITIYSNQRNLVSDLHRLHLLRCYFLSIFTGSNRMIHGLGFTYASRAICKDVGLLKGSSHAHNIFAQITADNGPFALIVAACIGGLFLIRAFRQANQSDNPLVLASSSLYLMFFLHLQIEGGWGKVTFIQAMLGLSFGAITMEFRRSTLGIQFPAGRDHETTLSDL